MKTTLVVCMLFVALPAFAHHSFDAEFDSTKPVKLTGTVTKIEWTNPHTWFYLDIKDASTGKVESWGFEMGNPVSLGRQGWTRDTLKIGMVVSVEGSRARDGSTKANARNVLVDGKKLGAASSQNVAR